MVGLSTKPYLIRAIYEWCADAGLTPYLSVKVDDHTRVPVEYVKNGEIVLNVSISATRNLTMGNDLIQFSARFNGVSREISVPMHAVLGVFARENGQGMFFQADPVPPELSGGVEAQADAIQAEQPVPLEGAQDASPPRPDPGRGRLKLVK